ncbi:uncharacterized protein E0L32_006998 [Thyridium curvatum]|uniref:NADP-dependent oxidoreductase domain-containing protein n=1 Tax=Thyridium curvatum TaxID=1093900 RepID=A0A507B5N9_9PEZI|nr:uncharacterized protein E0L32_006998 [Thyridium curvatum]TPX12351.1 hypothetical protein E0L32_006998 [Thyridium curvatum]
MSTPPIPPALQKSIDSSEVEYVNLGTSGLRVSVPILGAMGLGTPEWQPWVLAEEESIAVLKAAWDRGITTWDTADMYSNGISEEVIGKAIRRHNIPRHKLVLLTKCYVTIGEEPAVNGTMWREQMRATKDYSNNGGLSRASIMHAVDASLARLGTTYIDLYQVHRFDYGTPVEETMEALNDLVRAGKVRYIGASSMWATQFARMQAAAERRGWARFVSMQNVYNLLYREEEREMIRYCRDTGVGVIPWGPMSGGLLARPLGGGGGGSTRAKTGRAYVKDLSEADAEIVRRVEKVAKDKGWAMSHVALAWTRAKGTIPIVGFNSVERIQDAVAMKGKALTEEEVKFLEEPYVPKQVVGHF